MDRPPIEEIKEYDWSAYTDALCDYALELEEKVKRLEEALKLLYEMGKEGMTPNYNEWLTFHDKVAQIASQAINQI